MLRRKAYDLLTEWKGRAHKPLLVKGQMQVGKSYTVEEFARENYAHYVKVDRRMMFEDTNIRISDDGVEHYPLYAAAFMDSMGDSMDIDDIPWTEPIDFDTV